MVWEVVWKSWNKEVHITVVILLDFKDCAPHVGVSRTRDVFSQLFGKHITQYYCRNCNYSIHFRKNTNQIFSGNPIHKISKTVWNHRFARSLSGSKEWLYSPRLSGVVSIHRNKKANWSDFKDNLTTIQFTSKEF